MKTETPEPRITNTPVTEAASPRDEAVEWNPPSIQLKNILVPLDLSEMSLKSLQYAVPFAKQFGAKLTLLHVLNPPIYPSDFPYPGPNGQDCFSAIQCRLDEIRDSMIPAELPTGTIVRQGFAFDGILEVAREIHADLIISTTHGRTGLDHLLLGSTAENIARRAPCPVLVLREHEKDFV
ncbi:MAG: universal stress protein [Chthoniobacter sp.]|nr:universal stress protein [Chthoniobacter sp.]